jgi:predicted GIY-YIG superfamily endonuclease
VLRIGGGTAERRLSAEALAKADFDSIMYHVYLLQSRVDRSQYYAGFTEDVRERLAHHNAGGSVHTNKFRPWELKTVVSFADREQALAFERYLKTGSGRAFAARHFR